MESKLRHIFDQKISLYRVERFRIFFTITLIIILSTGCSSDGGGAGSTGGTGGNIDPTPGYETYTTPGSDLVLSIPDSLEVQQGDIIDIYTAAKNVPHCYTTNQAPIDIVLAQTCVIYDYFYLYPQYFPQGLDAIKTAMSYVSYLQEKDPFTFYMSPEEFDYVMSFFSGARAFIGFSVEWNGETVSDQTPMVITDISPFTRAWIDGFQVGDQIIAVDGVSIEGMSPEAADFLFPTDEEESVEITVDRNGVEMTIDTAAEENIALRLYPDMIYLSVRSFTETTGEEIRRDINELQTEAGGTIDKLILDLRDNGGGSISGMLSLVDYLIDNDTGMYPIMTTTGPAYDEETSYLGDYSDYNIGNFHETNFVLLINENSASASETTASALKHYSTAYLIGETTFGKGIGQSIVDLVDKSGVAIPSFDILPPSGVSYHLVGISPDYYLDGIASAFDDDPVLDAAVEYLNNGRVSISALGEAVRKRGVPILKKTVDPLKEWLLERERSDCY